MKYKLEEIGNIIRAERKKRKMSQETLAVELGITNKQVSNYENGELIPPMDKLLKLCKIFDCEMGYILGEKDYSQGTKLKTIITNEMGLSIEAVNTIIQITGDGRECINWGYESEKYRRILNNLFTSKGFVNFIETLAELDDSYQEKEQSQEILSQLSNELGKQRFNKAMEWCDVPSEVAEEADLTIEDCEAIQKVKTAFEEYKKLFDEFTLEMKVHRFSLHEVLTFLVNEMYPMSN